MSKEAKFTGGEWYADSYEVKSTVCCISLAKVTVFNEGKANAHLIAAAPEMYDELKAIRDIFEAHDAEVFKDSIECLDNVLAKARGEL
jgi:hypothetical protein